MCSVPSEWMQFSEPAQHSGVTPLASFPVLSPSRLLQPLICWVGDSSQRSLVCKITRVQTEGLPCCILQLSVPSQSDLRCFIQVPYFSSQLNFKEWFLPQSESTPCLSLLIINIWKIVSCSTAALDMDFCITEGMSENCALIAIRQACSSSCTCVCTTQSAVRGATLVLKVLLMKPNICFWKHVGILQCVCPHSEY